MRGTEALKTLSDRLTESHQFVKWWRKENDFLDYDLVSQFKNNISGSEEIGGIDLLTMDEMWSEVKRVGGTRVNLVHDRAGDRVEWVVKGKKGLRTKVCKYTPQALMTIFDIETAGNPVDS